MDLKIVRPAELAESLSVSTVTLWRMQKRGELPPKRQISSGVVGWLYSDLEEWLKERPLANNEEILEEL
jgi:predicted DNA-binding transcriptional regulator AlpA